MTCKEPNCSKKVHSRGYCNNHYAQARYRGYLTKRKTKSKEEIRYSNAQSQAKYRSLPFLLSLEEYNYLIKQPCHYCSKETGNNGVGLDRKDNNIGYTFLNVLPCCGSCNRIRGDDLTVEEMEIAMKSVTYFRQTKTAKIIP
jgi:hypothetical protein